MTTEEVIKVVEANVDKSVWVTWTNGTEPSLVLVTGVHGEGFTYYVNIPLYDPNIMHDCQYWDVAEVRPSDEEFVKYSD